MYAILDMIIYLKFRWTDANCNFLQEEIIRDLRRQFGQFALFFWNGITGDTVHVVWKPAAILPQNMAILDCAGRFPIESSSKEGEAKVVFNGLEILGRIINACNGYVSSFDIL